MRSRSQEQQEESHSFEVRQKSRDYFHAEELFESWFTIIVKNMNSKINLLRMNDFIAAATLKLNSFSTDTKQDGDEKEADNQLQTRGTNENLKRHYK